MSKSPTLGEQLTQMINAVRNSETYNTNTMPRSTSLLEHCIFLVWPLLPLLPPEPPTLVTDLLRRQEVCDVCGTTPQTTMPSWTKSTCFDETLPPTVVKLRSKSTAERTPLEKLMADIEKKMDETISSIETTAQKSTEISKQTEEVRQSRKSQFSDAEMLKKLNSLVNEKAKQEKKVKDLEVKEQQLKESLMTAIAWVKSVDTKEMDFKKSQEETVDEEKISKPSEENMVTTDTVASLEEPHDEDTVASVEEPHDEDKPIESSTGSVLT